MTALTSNVTAYLTTSSWTSQVALWQ